MSDGFIGRWSRRKLDAKAGRPLEDEPPPPPAAVPRTSPAAHPAAPAGVPAADARAAERGAATPDAPAPPPPPTMDDVQALTPDSDFSRFTGAQVAPEVRNAAMKKLFADPHFNVMDGLDIYIDDYGKPDPLPPGMLRQLASAKALGLFKDNTAGAPPQENPEATATPAAGAAPGDLSEQDSPHFVAQSGPPEPDRPAASPHDADPDLRLQQDPAPGPEGTGRGDR